MKYLSIIPFLFLAGCVKYVNVPVWVCPTPPEINVSELKIDSLTSNSGTDEILKAMMYDITYLRGENETLTNYLNVYRQPPSVLQGITNEKMLLKKP